MEKRIWIGLLAGFFLFIIVYLTIGLSNGERLGYSEELFYENSLQEQPLASCLKYHGDVVSNVDIYNDFVEDCDYSVDSTYNPEYFTDKVVVLMFFDGSSSQKPKAFYDYLFMNDGYEVIQVRYHHSLFGRTKDRTWYVYFVEMRKNQIQSKDIFFD